MFLPIDGHCAALAYLLAEAKEREKWNDVCDWLLVAASVESVELSTAKHQNYHGFCSSADEFDDAREDLLKRFIEEYSVFNLIWSALESSLTDMHLTKHPDKSKRGKIRDACSWLHHCFINRYPVKGLVDEVAAFRLAAQQCLGFETVERRFSEVSEIGHAGIGLYTVYELRNKFAHGSLAFPMPDENNRPVSSHESMVKHASRIVLLELQMLFLAYFCDLTKPVSFSWHPGSDLEEGPLWLALRTCHLTYAECSYQLSLFGDV